MADVKWSGLVPRLPLVGAAAAFGLILAVVSVVLTSATATESMASETVRIHPPAVSWPNHQQVQEEAARNAEEEGARLGASDVDAAIAPDLSTIRVAVTAENRDRAEEIASTIAAGLVDSVNQSEAGARTQELAARGAALQVATRDLVAIQLLHETGEASDLQLSEAAVALAEATTAVDRGERALATLPTAWIEFAGDPEVRPDEGHHPFVVAMAGTVFLLLAAALSKVGSSRG